MPIEDGCLTEEEALKAKWVEAEGICNLALQALMDWVERRGQELEECAFELGGPPDFGDTDLDPMLQHELERLREEFEANLMDCINNHADVIEAWNLYLDLQTECDIAREEAMALQDEYEACLHALHEGIPFA